jgi:glycosyltransferase involved in cell wall biosynthesis
MAGGTPVLTSNVTSLPEAVGDAALTVDPYSVDALRDGIDRLAFDDALRARLREAGPVQARRHSWDAVAAKVGKVLAELRASVPA